MDDQVALHLQLAGVVASAAGDRGRVLRVRNRIFATVFDLKWVKEQMAL